MVQLLCYCRHVNNTDVLNLWPNITHYHFSLVKPSKWPKQRDCRFGSRPILGLLVALLVDYRVESLLLAE